MDRYLEPTYLETDFETSKERLKELMQQSDTFKDYNYEGANITMLLELISFLNDNSTYFMNKLVKNIYPESAEVYETMHSIAEIRGYKPRGWIAPNLNLQVNVLVDSEEDKLPSPGEQLMVPAWFRIQVQTENGDNVYYMTTKEYIINIPEDLDGGEYTFTIPMKEGNYFTKEYTGDDIVDNKIIIPFHTFDHDVIPYDQNPSIALYVNEEMWTRTDDFRHTILEDEDKLYMLEYDKYQRYNITFSPTHNVPSENDRIQVIINKTHGPEGDIHADYIEDFNEEDEIPIISENGITTETQRFLQNITRDMIISKDYIEVWNPDASFNSSTPETIEEIRRNSRGNIYSQYRNVNGRDYRIHLAENPNIIVGNAWGEREINPQNTEEYNKVYLSAIPREYGKDTMVYNTINWSREEVSQNEDIIKLVSYTNSFEEEIYKHLAPRKGLGVYEIAVVPELVYFAFDIGITVRRAYNFANVREEVKDKLKYYFKPINREFGDTIDFKKIQNFLLDKTIRDENNRRFFLTKGIESIVIRDLLTYTPSLSGSPDTIFEPNDNLQCPMFTKEDFELDYENTMRPIKLGMNQFPVLALENCVFINEK